jgi:hypothetical protein
VRGKGRRPFVPHAYLAFPQTRATMEVPLVVVCVRARGHLRESVHATKVFISTVAFARIPFTKFVHVVESC